MILRGEAADNFVRWMVPFYGRLDDLRCAVLLVCTMHLPQTALDTCDQRSRPINTTYASHQMSASAMNSEPRTREILLPALSSENLSSATAPLKGVVEEVLHCRKKQEECTYQRQCLVRQLMTDKRRSDVLKCTAHAEYDEEDGACTRGAVNRRRSSDTVVCTKIEQSGAGPVC